MSNSWDAINRDLEAGVPCGQVAKQYGVPFRDVVSAMMRRRALVELAESDLEALAAELPRDAGALEYLVTVADFVQTQRYLRDFIRAEKNVGRVQAAIARGCADAPAHVVRMFEVAVGMRGTASP